MAKGALANANHPPALREAQVAAQQLPLQNLLVFTDLKQAILQQVSLSSEQRRQRFRSLDLGKSGRPFFFGSTAPGHLLQMATVQGRHRRANP